MGLQSEYLPPTCRQVQRPCSLHSWSSLSYLIAIGHAAMCWLGPAGGRERFSGWFNRVQVAGTDQALVAEDEALRAGVAEASAAEVLAPRVWIKGRGWGGLRLGSGSGFYRKYY